jgi:hypothetical protein
MLKKIQTNGSEVTVNVGNGGRIPREIDQVSPEQQIDQRQEYYSEFLRNKEYRQLAEARSADDDGKDDDNQLEEDDAEPEGLLHMDDGTTDIE